MSGYPILATIDAAPEAIWLVPGSTQFARGLKSKAEAGIAGGGRQ